MSSTPSELPLDAEAERICTAATYKALRGKEPSVLHWLLAIAETSPESLKQVRSGYDLSALRQQLRSAIRENRAGPELPKTKVLDAARAAAAEKGNKRVSGRDIAEIVLREAEPHLPQADEPKPSEHAAAEQSPSEPPKRSRRPEVPAGVEELFEIVRSLRRGSIPVLREEPSSSGSGGILAACTTDLTEMARDGKLLPVVFRDKEIDFVMETLCRTIQRNPALVGPAGVGKTAIAEGVAARIAAEDCPPMLRGVRVHALQPASLLAGVSSPPEYVERVKRLIEEASDPKVILFVDEFHSLLERGTVMEHDLVNLLKPALARGDIACMAATTDDEYRRIIESDSALSRRFQAIRVSEMTAEQTMVVLKAHRERLQHQRSVSVSDAVLRKILQVAGDRLPSRRFPDKAVVLLEQVVAHAVFKDRPKATVRDVTVVVEQLTGAPSNVDGILQDLGNTLADKRLLKEDEIEKLVGKLKVASRGLDISPERPNAIILMTGGAALGAEALAAAIAESMAGSPERVVDIDFSVMVHPADITRLTGASPSYVGYGEQLPIHAFLQYPWSVLLCRNVDLCHRSILTTLINALRRGAIQDGMGKTIRLCDSVVILTAGDHRVATSGPIGLRARGVDEWQWEKPLQSLPKELLDICTLVVEDVTLSRPDLTADFLEDNVLSVLAERYRDRGLWVELDKTAVDWLLSKLPQGGATGQLRDEVAALLGKYLTPYLPKSGQARVRLKADGDELRVERLKLNRRRS